MRRLRPEPRILTVEEVRNLEPGTSVWHECWFEVLGDKTQEYWLLLDGGKAATELMMCVLTPDGTLHDKGGFTYLLEITITSTDDYKQRYWLGEPTREQRIQAKWE